MKKKIIYFVICFIVLVTFTIGMLIHKVPSSIITFLDIIFVFIVYDISKGFNKYTKL